MQFYALIRETVTNGKDKAGTNIGILAIHVGRIGGFGRGDLAQYVFQARIYRKGCCGFLSPCPPDVHLPKGEGDSVQEIYEGQNTPHVSVI